MLLTNSTREEDTDATEEDASPHNIVVGAEREELGRERARVQRQNRSQPISVTCPRK
jgi:hypothetical protein